MKWRLLLGLAAGALLAVASSVIVVLAHGFQPFGPAEKLAQVAADTVWIFAGVIASARRPDNRTGLLMMAVGFVDLAQELYWNAALPFTIAQVIAFASTPVTLHLFMAFPSGQLTGRAERRYVASAYALVLLLSPLSALFWDWQRNECPACPPNLLLVTHDPRLWGVVSTVGDLVLICLLGSGVVLLIRRVRRATPATRRAFAPVLVTAAFGVVGLCAVIVIDALGFETEGSPALWIADVLYAAIPVAFLLGLLRMRWHRTVVADLVVELHSASDAGKARDAIAAALDDPSLQLAFWLPDGERFVDADGQPVVAAERPDQAVMLLTHEGTRVGALVHDPCLRDDPRLLEAVAAAVGLALENARLQAELRAQLAEVRASRARIVAAGDAERRRLERDLHDGAQQRLLGIRLALKLARGQLHEGNRRADATIAEADAEVVAALDELRGLARGIHPAILTEEGLGPALGSLARTAPLPVELRAGSERLPAPLEATSYFVAAEALANIVKHAHADHVTIDVARRNGYLVVDVVDDGRGGADPSGDGLRGLRDRVESLDGRLTIDSPVGCGTRVSAVIPCE